MSVVDLLSNGLRNSERALRNQEGSLVKQKDLAQVMVWFMHHFDSCGILKVDEWRVLCKKFHNRPSWYLT